MNEVKRLEREKNKAVSLGKWKEAGEYSNCIGATLSELGQYDEALRSHHEELEFYNIIKDRLGMAVANRKIGECYAELHNFNKSLHHVNLFLELSKSINSAVEEQRAWATLGRTYYLKYKNETDPEFAKKALDLSEKASLNALELLDKINSEVTSQDYAQAKSRILLNLGLICEDNDLTKCAENIRLAIYWAAKYDLYEDLNRCQFTLADVYRKHEQYGHAVKLLDSSIETAGRLHNKTLLCDVLCSKANILLVLNDFEGAKKCYKKAYKIHYPNEEEHKKVEQCLKICTGLCITLRQLEISDSNERKQLFEKIADCLSNLECYKQALHYYKKTLNCLEEDLECPAVKKAPIYFSIAKTYHDLEENDKSIEYFKMELECNENKPAEQVKTLWEMVELYKDKQDLSECEKLLVKAISLVETAGNTKLFVKALEKLSSFYEEHSMISKLNDVKVRLRNLKNEDLSSDNESETDESEDLFHNIVISESEEEDDKNSKLYPRRQRRNQKPINKKNLKGETPLHEACINGDLAYVKMLIENKVNVNAKDNAGWTSLHEACNYGHYTIAEYLLKNGANINDRGGKDCNGITPLHDACQNGHLDVIELLLSKGALPTILRDDGVSALQLLLEWKCENELNEATIMQCENIENQLKTKMEHAGQDINIKCVSSSSDINTIFSISDSPSSRHSDKRSRSSSTSSEDDSPYAEICNLPSPRTSGWDDSEEGATAYKNIMSSLRRSAKTMPKQIAPEVKSPPLPALVNENEIVDEWLIKDTVNRPKAKKRKMLKLNVSKNKSITQYINIKDKLPDNNLASTSDESQDFITEDSDQPSERSRDEGIHHECANPNNSESNLNDGSNLPFYLRVKICDKLILVPIIEEATSIGDLAEEAAQRYYDIVGNRPVLRLTKLGALLRDSDIVKTIFNNNEEISAFVESWIEQSMEENYVQLCKKLKLVPINDVKTQLQNSNTEIKFPNCLIPTSHMNLLLSAVSKYSKLRHLDISSNVITDSGFCNLVSAFPVFEYLVLLNINCCCITFESLKLMSDYLTEHKEYSKKLPKLETLNLGNNLFFSKCNVYLVSIFQLPSLTTVSLNSCHLDSHFFENLDMCSSLSNIEKLEELDISGNYFGSNGVAKLLSYLPKKNLKILNLSHTVDKPSKMGLHISNFLLNELCSLKEIILEDCHLKDTDLNILSKCLTHCPRLQLLNISSNPSLSDVGICNFLKLVFTENSQLVDVIFTATCKWNSRNIKMLSDALKLRTLKHVHIDCIPKSLQLDLFNVWREIYQEEAVCVSLSSMLCELNVK